MIGLVLLAAFGHFAASQTTYDCQCGFFVAEQIPGQIGVAAPVPLKHENFPVEPEVCLESSAGYNTCKQLCDQWGLDIEATGFSLCDAQADDTTEGIQRCYGGLYCEALYQDERLPDEGELETAIRVYARILECAESSGYQTWNPASYQHPEALCCSALARYESCYEACDCVKADPLRYCECGVFAAVQFQQGDEENDALPFKMVSSTVGDTPLSFCAEYEGGAASEECRSSCEASGTDYFLTYSLSDSASLQYNVDPDLTFGQLYCNTLRSRRIFYNQYINTELRTYKRAPLCDVLPANIWWQEVNPQVDHPERLCCTEDGVNEFPCPNLQN